MRKETKALNFCYILPYPWTQQNRISKYSYLHQCDLHSCVPGTKNCLPSSNKDADGSCPAFWTEHSLQEGLLHPKQQPASRALTCDSAAQRLQSCQAPNQMARGLLSITEERAKQRESRSPPGTDRLSLTSATSARTNKCIKITNQIKQLLWYFDTQRGGRAKRALWKKQLATIPAKIHCRKKRRHNEDNYLSLYNYRPI